MTVTKRTALALLLTAATIGCGSDKDRVRSGQGDPPPAVVSVTPPGPLVSVVGEETFTPAKTPEVGKPDKPEPPLPKDPRFDRPIDPVGPLGRKDPLPDPADPPQTGGSVDKPATGAKLDADQQSVLATLQAAAEKTPADRAALARVVGFLLAVDRPVMAEQYLARRKALEGYEGGDHALDLALARLDRRLGRSEAGFDRLLRATRAEAELMPLSLKRSAFVTENPPAFGLQRKRASATFKAGGFFRLYVEVGNFVLKHDDSGRYNAAFEIQLKLTTAEGTTIAWTRWSKPRLVKREFRSPIADLFVLPRDNLPPGLQPGDHELVVELTDLNKTENAKALVRVPLKISGAK